MRDSNSEQQAQNELMPESNSFFQLLILRLLSSIDPEGKIISSEDKDLVELVLHHGSLASVAEIKGLTFQKVSYRYNRAVSKLEEAVSAAGRAIELQEQVDELKKRLNKSEKRLEKLGQDRKILRYKELKSKTLGDDLGNESEQNPEDIIRELRESIRLSNIKLSAKESANSSLRSKYDSLKEDYDAKSTRLKTTERDYVRCVKSESDLKAKNKLLSESINDLKEKLQSANKDVTACRQEISELNRKLRNATGVLEDKQDIIDNQQQKILKLQSEKKQTDKVIELEGKLTESRSNEKDLKHRINALERELNSACKSIGQQKKSYDDLLERIKVFEGIDAKGLIPAALARKNTDLIDKLKVVYEYKEEATNLWRKGLEEDLAVTKSLNKTQQAIIDELREENERLKAQIAEPENRT